MRIHTIVAIVLLIIAAGCTPLDFGYNKYPATAEVTAALPEDPQTPAVSDGTTTTLPSRTFTEGDLVSFPNLAATDPDGDTITYTFSSPLNTSGMWQTKEGDAGEYTIRITASDGKDTAAQEVRIIINAGNRPPVLHITDLTPRVSVGSTITIDATAEDPDGDNVTIVYSGWMDSATKVATRKDVGTHEVRVIASDGKKVVSESVHVKVDRTNSPPTISPLADRTVMEDETIMISPHVTDPDEDTVSISMSTPFDATNSWTPKRSDVGSHAIMIVASDGASSTNTTITITVMRHNAAPVLNIDKKAITLVEGETVTISATAQDSDGDAVTLSFSGWMNGDTYTTTNADQGIHEVTVTASDGVASANETVTITVEDVNRAPIFDPKSFI